MDIAESLIKKQSHDHSGNGLPSYASILGEICQESGVKLTWLSNNWVALLEKDEARCFTVGFKFNLNSAAASQIADDKIATYELLSHFGVPTVECRPLYEKDNPGPYAKNYQSERYIEDFFKKNRRHIVLKPNSGQEGINVYQISEMSQVKPVLEKIFRQEYLAAMCPFYEIRNEYRFIMLDGEVRLAYMKERNEGWLFNLSQGAIAARIEDASLYEKLLKLARQAVTMLGIRFCSVDMIETCDGNLMVMEVNSGVATGEYLRQHPEDYGKVKQIYADVLEKMFAEN